MFDFVDMQLPIGTKTASKVCRNGIGLDINRSRSPTRHKARSYLVPCYGK